MAKRNVRFKCPFCDRRFTREDLVRHIEDCHMDVLPEDFTPLRYVFNYVNRKDSNYHGKCTECGGKTPWDENKGRYNRQCGKESCHRSYIKKFETNMMRTKGVTRISATAIGQEKMLANRKISGQYTFQNGVKKTYTGSYEKKTLEFMDQVMNIDPNDIIAPGPVLEYIYDKKRHFYITDFYYQPYNLIIEVKDGGNNPNKRNMPEYRAKQIAKEEHIIKNTNYNYLRLTDNNLSQLLSIFADLKMQLTDDTGERVIHVNEMMNALTSGYIPGIKDTNSVFVVNYLQNNVFSNQADYQGIGICNSVKLDHILTRDKEGKLQFAPDTFLHNATYNVYATDIPISEVSKRVAPYIGSFVEEGFLYEAVFGKPLYQYDQIELEEHAFEIPDFYESMQLLESVTKSYLTNTLNEEKVSDYIISENDKNLFTYFSESMELSEANHQLYQNPETNQFLNRLRFCIEEK